MLEDEMLPEKYENKEVLWIETEAKHKVWPYSNRSWKRLRRKFTSMRKAGQMTIGKTHPSLAAILRLNFKQDPL